MGLCKLLNKPSVAETLINVQNLASAQPFRSYDVSRTWRLIQRHAQSADLLGVATITQNHP